MLISDSKISTHKNIFVTIKEIERIFEEQREFYSGTKEKVLQIVFDKKILYVDPLFLILLLNLHSKYSKQILAINITYLSELKQIIMHRHLIQFFDYLYIETSKTKVKNNYEIEDEAIAKSAKERIDADKVGILYYYSADIYKSISNLSLDDDRKYGMLPIMSVVDVPSYESLGFPVGEQDDRIKIYKKLALDDNQEDLKDVIRIFLQQLHDRGKKDIFYIDYLSMIIFEMLDNIKRHTKDENGESSNGFISFHRDSSKQTDLFELIITDDFEEGFLNRYKIVLENELERIRKDFKTKKQNLDENIVQSYIDDIKLLENDNISSDKKILEKLFDNKKTFGVHQISRFSMHFGIPSLMKLLKKLKGELSIYLHKNSRYYKIIFRDNETHMEEFSDGIDGTYYHIQFPEYEEEESDRITAPKLNLENVNYQEIFKQKNLLQEQVEEFKFKNFQELTDVDNTYKNKYLIASYKDFQENKPKDNNLTISDFIRNIYRYINLHDTQDILIVDFPIDSNRVYLQTLVEILYFEGGENTINLALLDAKSVSAIFIGGKNQGEFCHLNAVLSKNYNQNKEYFFRNFCKKHDNYDEELFSKSKLFTTIKVKEVDRHIFLPFELFKIDSKDILANMIENNLDANKIKMHIDTGQNYHINYFYKFKNIFEDSSWVLRIAFKLAQQIFEKNYKIIGTNKYANAIIASAYSILEENKNYFVLNDFSENSIKSLKRYIDNNSKYLIYSPVIFEGKKIQQDIIDKYLNKNQNIWTTTVKIDIEKEDDNFNALLNFELKKEDYEDISKNNCNACVHHEERALYKLSQDNPFVIENFHLENYKSKNIKSYCEDKNIIAKFFGTVYFGHTVRGNNHYTYYTKSIEFFKRNYNELSEFLKNIKDMGTDNKKDNIIFTPIHNTNARFVSLVNEKVFDNNATIYHFDKSKTEQNFYDLQSIEIDAKDSDIYFVDDEISSSGTLKYFESLLHMINSNGEIKFNGIITMIDRTSPQDEKTIQRLFQNKKINIFTKLEIKPIKTDFGDCFLCQRRKQYIKMFDNSALDMTRFQIAKRVVKLKDKNYDEVDYAEDDNFETKLKTFIKMHAVDFAHKNFYKFEDVDIKEDSNNKLIRVYGEIEKEFKDYIYEIINNDLDNELSKRNYFKSICDYEAEIALLKSISFPKIVYFRLIREIATVAIIKKIKDVVNGDSPQYIEIYKGYSEDYDKSQFEIKSILYNADELSILETDIKQEGFSEYKDFLEKFKKKNGVDYINFLYRTAGYLNITQILDDKNIRFFYRMTIELKDLKNDFDDSHHLLHAYPFATKMIVSNKDNKDKFKYFKKNLNDFKVKNIGSFDNPKYSMIHAMILENGEDLKEIFNEAIYKGSEDNINKRVQNIVTFLEKKIKNDIKVENIYINENLNIEYNDGYKEYLKSSKLIDVKNDFNEISENKEKVEKLYKGLLRGSIDLEYTKIDNNTKIDNTWSNIVFEDDKKYFAIKLVDIDIEKLEEITEEDDVMKNSPIWFKPIGCIVVSFDGIDTDHLMFSEVILSLQKEIVEFFKLEFQHKSITQMIRVKNYDELVKSLNNISHTYGKYIEIDKKIEKLRESGKNDKDILDMVKIFSNGLKYVFETGSMESPFDLPNKNNIGMRLTAESDFYKFLKSFLKVTPYFIYDNNSESIEDRKKINYTIDIIEGSYYANIDKTTRDLYIIIFELIFNGINKNRGESVNFKIIINNAIYIANTGEPILSDQLDSIFEDGKSTSHNGLGMGLHRIKKYLESHNICIDAKGKNNNLDSKFNVIFQIYNKEEDAIT